MRKPKTPTTELDLTFYTKTGKLRKRKPKTTRDYFNKATEDAIVAYNKSKDPEERNYLFEKYINYSLHKLAENIIHTFKFYCTGSENVDDLKHEVVYFLLEKFHLYKQSSGKAYSYFGTIAKRYLIVKDNKQKKIQQDRRDIDHVDEDKKTLRAAQELENDQEITHFLKSYIRYVELNIDGIHENITTIKGEKIREYVSFTTKDKDIVYTILDLLKKAEELEVFYKPAIYLQIRETTGQKTVDITRVIKILKSIMKKQSAVYYHDGALDIDETDIYNQHKY